MKPLRKYNFNLFLFNLFLIFFTYSCKKPETYPNEPIISYKDLTFKTRSGFVGGTILLSLNFTDGDGDVGLYEKDSVAPFDYNLFINMFKQDSGKMKPVIFPDSTLTYHARVPVLTANSNYKTLKGVIEYEMDVISDDTLQLEVYIKDRALNTSNKIQTPKFTIKGGVIN